MHTVELHSESSGNPEAPSIVILHGMLGNSRNWQRVRTLLDEDYQVHALDLRNHGKSPHAEPMSYPAMSADVGAWIEQHVSGPVHLVGHSMGGKVAMTLACRSPQWVRSLLVVDIAPKEYAPRWKKEFAAMQAMDVSNLQSRQEAEDELGKTISDWAFRKFLITNLERRPEGGFRWVVNLSLLEASLPELFQQPLGEDERYDGPTLFVRGEKSRFVEDPDEAAIRRFFPFGQMATVPGAGHNVHFDQVDAFVDLIREFWNAVG